MAGIRVSVDNFVRAESDRMFAAIAAQAGGVGKWSHGFVPTPIDQQAIIRMNRDTLYSAAVVDISRGATLTVPPVGDRYVSVMVVNQDHYINAVFHDPGEYRLTAADFDTEFVMLAVRVLVDPENPADVAEVNDLQRAFTLHADENRPYVLPEYDETSLTATRDSLLALAKGLDGLDHCFGTRAEVDPIRHLVGTAAGWGGLPEREAYYINVSPGLPEGKYTLTVGEVPVDGFWSISLYNAQGYFAENEQGAYNVNSITGARNPDGTVTITFGGGPDDVNPLPVMDGWNYLVRLYRPRDAVFDGSWSFPAIAATA